MLIIIIHFVHGVRGLNLDPCCWGLGIHVVLAKMLFGTKGLGAGTAGEQVGGEESRGHTPSSPAPSSSLWKFCLVVEGLPDRLSLKGQSSLPRE